MARKPISKFDVWTRNIEDENSWELAGTLCDADEAIKLAKKLGHEDTISSVWELGTYTVDEILQTDQMLFWWSNNARNLYRKEIIGRGVGYAEQSMEWVEYEPATGGLATASDKSVSPKQRPKQQYRIAACSECGLQLPQNRLHRYIEEVQVGRASATYRVSTSRSRRTGAHNYWSNTSRQGISRSSGRSYYRNVEKLLCDSCFKQKEEADDDDGLFWFTADVFLYGALIVLFIVAGAIFVYRLLH